MDVGSFAHTAFSVGETETSDEVIEVLEGHGGNHGVPVGALSDSFSANISEQVSKYLQAHGIEMVPAGPDNPPGNCTVKGAFSQMKQVLGTIRLDASSLKALAKSV